MSQYNPAPHHTVAKSRGDPIKYVFLWPAFLVVLAVGLFPLVFSFSMSFQSLRLIPPIPPKFVGFDNYWTILQTERFWHVIGTTTMIAVISVVIEYLGVNTCRPLDG